jgi:hypothetical protein
MFAIEEPNTEENILLLRFIEQTKELAKSCLTCQNRYPDLTMTSDSIMRYCTQI